MWSFDTGIMRYEVKRSFTELLTNFNKCVKIVVREKKSDGFFN